MSNVFESLDKEFDIEEEVKETETKTALKIQEVKEGIQTQKYNLEDKNYLKTELQDLIATNRLVLETLAGQIKFGCDLGLVTTFATISKTITDNIAELIKLEKQITDYQVTESNENMKREAMEQRERIANNRISAKKPGIPGTLSQTNNIICSNSKDVLEMILSKNKKKELVESEMPEFKFADEGEDK